MDDNKLERMWKEAVMTGFKALSQHLHGETERACDISVCSPGKNSNQTPFKYESYSRLTPELEPVTNFSE
jgi:hypothetical protein